MSALQINACEEELLALYMYVNQKKSMCIRFDRRFSVQCVELVTASGGRLKWVDRCHYLGVYFTSAYVAYVASKMLNPISLGRLTPFSVKLVVAHPNQ